jgi:hypothetical protein
VLLTADHNICTGRPHSRTTIGRFGDRTIDIRRREAAYF